MDSRKDFLSLQIYVIIYPLLYLVGHYFLFPGKQSNISLYLMSGMYATQIFRFFPIWSQVRRNAYALFIEDKGLPMHDQRSFHFVTPLFIMVILGFMFGVTFHDGIVYNTCSILMEIFLLLGTYYAFQSIEILVQHMDEDQLYRMNIRTDTNKRKRLWRR
jgi:hypothetical protein